MEETVIVEEVDDQTEKTVSKTQFDKVSSELAYLKKQIREKNTAEENARIEQEEKDLRIKDLELQVKKSSFVSGLSKGGYSEQEVTKISELLTNGDEEGLIKALTNARKDAIKELEQEVERLKLEATERPAHGSNDDGQEVTKEEFEKMTYIKKVEFKNKYPDLYKKYI